MVEKVQICISVILHVTPLSKNYSVHVARSLCILYLDNAAKIYLELGNVLIIVDFPILFVSKSSFWTLMIWKPSV
jgi:hypothetical protein